MTTEQNNGRYPLYGLVLAGGKSVRMGQDKGAIKWHGIEQRYHLHNMLSHICDKVFISCRSAQKDDVLDTYPVIFDTRTDSGPIVALLSAFEHRSDVAWLVVACDLPLLDIAALKQLIENRNFSGIATTYQSPYDGLPEPLVTIWEPDSYQILMNYVELGLRCPRKVLINNMDKVVVVQSTDPQLLLNANTPEDALKVRNILLFQ